MATTAMLALLILSLAKAGIQGLNLRLFFRENYPLLVLTAVFFAYLISLAYSTDVGKGLKFIEREIPLLLMPVIVAINRSLVRKKLKLYLGFFIAGCAFNGLSTLFFYSLPEAQSIKWVEQLSFLNLKPYQQLSKREAFGVYSPFLDRLQFSNLLALAVISCLWMWTQSKGPMRKTILICAGVILLFCSVILGGKGGQLALAAGLGVWILIYFFHRMYPYWKRQLSRVGAISSFILLMGTGSLLLPYLLYKYVPPVTQRYNQMKWELDTFYSDQYQDYDYVHFTTIRRILSWQNTWELIQKHPIGGVGVGDYEPHIQAIYAQNNPEFPANSHNHYLFVWANCGIWGLLLFLTSLGIWFYGLSPFSLPAVQFPLSLLVIFCSIMVFDSLISQVDTLAFGLFLTMGGLAGKQGLP